MWYHSHDDLPAVSPSAPGSHNDPMNHSQTSSPSVSTGSYAYDLGRIATDHPNLYRPALELWADSLAIRAGQTYKSVVIIALNCRTKGTRGRCRKESLTIKLAMHSSGTSTSKLASSIGYSSVTESAALCVALATIVATSDLRVREVTLRGDSGDYWLVDTKGKARGICEMSGTTTKTAASIYRAKRKQVLSNKSAPECYTSVTRFSPHVSYFCRVR